MKLPQNKGFQLVCLNTFSIMFHLLSIYKQLKFFEISVYITLTISVENTLHGKRHQYYTAILVKSLFLQVLPPVNMGTRGGISNDL